MSDQNSAHSAAHGTCAGASRPGTNSAREARAGNKNNYASACPLSPADEKCETQYGETGDYTRPQRPAQLEKRARLKSKTGEAAQRSHVERRSIWRNASCHWYDRDHAAAIGERADGANPDTVNGRGTGIPGWFTITGAVVTRAANLRRRIQCLSLIPCCARRNRNPPRFDRVLTRK